MDKTNTKESFFQFKNNNPFKPKQPNLYGQPKPQPVDPLMQKNNEMIDAIRKEQEAEVLKRLEAEKLQRQREYDERLMKQIEEDMRSR